MPTVPLRDYIYAAAIIILLIAFGWYTVHERDVGQAKEIAALRASSDKLLANANKTIATLTAQHAAEVAQVKENLNAQIQAANAQHDSDLQRLRAYDAYRHSHPALPGAVAGPAASTANASGSGSLDERLTSLELVALQLAAAGREVDASLTACLADRNALTGK
jgi:hypothetical protein